MWQHPDLLPDSEDLGDPAASIDRVIGGNTSGIDEAVAEFERAADGGPAKLLTALWTAESPCVGRPALLG
jgi:hypothetical protein